MPKKKQSIKGKGKYAAYRSQNRREKNKIAKLKKRWKRYKIQPPKALNGILDAGLRAKLKQALEKLQK